MFNINSGNIQTGILYFVYGAQSVIYNGTTYTTGQQFRGIPGVTVFTYSGLGTQLLYEVLEAQGASVVYDENAVDNPIFSETTKLSGFSIEFMQTSNDIQFNDVTTLFGFAIELIDYPFYSFAILERRL